MIKSGGCGIHIGAKATISSGLWRVAPGESVVILGGGALNLVVKLGSGIAEIEATVVRVSFPVGSVDINRMSSPGVEVTRKCNLYVIADIEKVSSTSQEKPTPLLFPIGGEKDTGLAIFL